MSEYFVYYVSDIKPQEIWRLLPEMGPLTPQHKEELMNTYLREPDLRGSIVCYSTDSDPLSSQAANRDEFPD